MIMCQKPFMEIFGILCNLICEDMIHIAIGFHFRVGIMQCCCLCLCATMAKGRSKVKSIVFTGQVTFGFNINIPNTEQLKKNEVLFTKYKKRGKI